MCPAQHVVSQLWAGKIFIKKLWAEKTKTKKQYTQNSNLRSELPHYLPNLARSSLYRYHHLHLESRIFFKKFVQYGEGFD